MYQRLHALKARILVVSLMFLASACVIQRANDQPKTGEEPVQPATPATKAEPEKAETAVAKASAAKVATGKTGAAKPAAVAKPAATPAPAATAATSAAKPADKKGAAAPASTAKFTRVSRFVRVENLNVRSRAEAHAPIVGRLARGSMITVSVDGTWAKIGDAQFVAVRHLTKSQPLGKRLVSRK